MHIVGEYLFIENFLVNYLILELVKLITRTEIKIRRILLGAFISALYPFVFFVPSLLFLSNFFMKILLSIFIIKLTFGKNSIKLLLKQLIAFYIVTFLFAGGSLAIHYFNIQNLSLTDSLKMPIKRYPIKNIFLGIVFSGLMFYHLFNYYKEKTIIENHLYKIIIYYKTKEISLIALKDTGNSLVDPLSKLPVLVVEFNLLKDILPNNFKRLYGQKNDLDLFAIENIMIELEDEMQLRLIPFKSIGNENGIILGFKPEYIKIQLDNNYFNYENVLIGIFNGELSKDGIFTGLIGQEIFTRGNKYAI